MIMIQTKRFKNPKYHLGRWPENTSFDSLKNGSDFNRKGWKKFSKQTEEKNHEK